VELDSLASFSSAACSNSPHFGAGISNFSAGFIETGAASAP
jgi:hypothetical protein